jgi:hypothetical protein
MTEPQVGCSIQLDPIRPNSRSRQADRRVAKRLSRMAASSGQVDDLRHGFRARLRSQPAGGRPCPGTGYRDLARGRLLRPKLWRSGQLGPVGAGWTTYPIRLRAAILARTRSYDESEPPVGKLGDSRIKRRTGSRMEPWPATTSPVSAGGRPRRATDRALYQILPGINPISQLDEFCRRKFINDKG